MNFFNFVHPPIRVFLRIFKIVRSVWLQENETLVWNVFQSFDNCEEVKFALDDRQNWITILKLHIQINHFLLITSKLGILLI